MTKIALIGRPNVGKSALFNAILGKRKAIVDPIKGTTRDLISHITQFEDKEFELFDTAGIESAQTGSLENQMMEKAHSLLETADIIFFIVDGQCGVQLDDLELAKKIHRMNKKTCLLVNKIDDEIHDDKVHQFASLGIPHVFSVSALHKRGLHSVFASLDLKTIDTRPSSIPICLIGKPNSGKSTLINALLNRHYCLTDANAGTTRDANFIPFYHQDQLFTLIDTAGLKKRKNMNEPVDVQSQYQAEKALSQADLILFMIDVEVGMSHLDKKIIHLIEKSKKTCIILLNKWDRVHGFRMEHTLSSFYEEAPFLRHCPTLCISAKKKKNIEKILPLALEIWKKNQTKIPTPKLNAFIEYLLKKTPPPMIKGKRLKIFYLTQTSMLPLSFLLFCNQPSLMTRTYKRYLTNELRAFFDLKGAFFYLHLKRRS